MKLFVTAKTNAREEKVESIDDTHFVVRVKATPVEGKANKAIAKALAKHLQIAPSRLILVSGTKSKSKVFEYE